MSESWKKGAPRSLWRTVSPRGKTPGGVAFVNNDVEELRQRRIEAHLRGVMSPSGRPAAFESAHGGVSVLSNAQIAEHYADCIKLSTENKINTRNAFGLHLIDYMLQMLMQYGELENFQVAGCTLDAGAKIYASRVDSIYSEAYKILGGILVNETDDKDQPENPAHHMREQSRKESYGTTLERNIKALNMSTKGITFGLESFMSEKVREDSLMLWQLLTRDDYSLVLDTLCSSTDAEPWCGNALEACSDSLRKVFMDVSTDVEICSTLSEFEINESQSMENVGSGEIPIHCGDLDYETSQPDYSMLPCPAYLQDSEGEDFGFDDTVESPKDRMYFIMRPYHNLDQQTLLFGPRGRDPGNEGVLGSKNFTVLYQDPLKIQSVQCDELQLTSTLVKSEYSYFDPTTLSTWAGLQHWKIKPVKLKDAKTIKSRRPKCMKINFRASVSSRTFENHQVTSPSVDGSLKSTNLPMDIHLKPNALHQLFIQGKWKVGKQNMDAFVEDDTEDSFLLYNGSCDTIEIPYSSSMNVSFGGQDLVEVNISRYELVSEPKKVEKISIGYSKKSKRIDAKRLKDTMWEIILKDDTDTSGKGRIDFSSLCFQVSTLVPENMKTDLTVPICFVFLLHLANEKGLVLSDGGGSSSEVMIRTSDPG